MDRVQAVFNGREHTRAEILAWEDRRIDAAAAKLRVAPPPAGEIAARREAWLETKLGLGTEAMLERLGRDLTWSGWVARAGTVFGGRRRRSLTDLYVPTGSAAEFSRWFEGRTEASDEPAMLRACPDHFVIRTGPRGQEVVETTGSSPLTTHFYVDYDDVSSLVTPADPAFPHQIAGVARTADGTPIGGVRHQFRDLGEGFHARLTVEFPLPTPGTMIRGHEWHLACEFSNWIEAA